MPAIRTIPGLKILLCILAGFLLAAVSPEVWTSWYSAMASILFVIPLLLYKRKAYNYPLFTLSAALAIALFSCCLYLRYQINLEHKETLLAHTEIERVALLEKSERRNSWRYRAQILDGPIKDIEIYLYSREALPYPIGTIVMLNETAEILEEPKNPDQFDYRSFLMRKGIFGRLFVHPETMQQTGKVSGWKYAPIIWRNHLLYQLEDFLPDEELPLAQALLLGFRDEMPRELSDKFRESGTMHLLAISGMHMGIIAWLLHLIFQRLFPYRRQKIWALIGTLFSLWFFLALCGFPSSGIRACFMISLFMIGRWHMKNQNTFNLLFCTAALMLLIKPGYVQDLGFQLSCAAVLGILIFYPKIYGVFSFRNKMLDSSYSLAALGISAQLGTLGLSMHYFHVFSPWFWLTGIPGAILATLNMIAGVIFLGVAVAIPAIAQVTGALFSIGLSALIRCMEWSYYLSWHHFEDIFWPSSMVWSYYLFLLFAAFFLHHKNRTSLLAALASLVLFFSSYYAHRINVVGQFEICKVLGLGHPVYEISRGRQLLVLNPDEVPPEKIEYFMREHRIRNGITEIIELKSQVPADLTGLLEIHSHQSQLNSIEYTYLEGPLKEKRQLPVAKEHVDYLTNNTYNNEKHQKILEAMDLP